jgi:archaeal cell division control protein 6
VEPQTGVKFINIQRFIRSVWFMRKMDIEKYLKDKQSELEKSKTRIINSNVFDFNYIPEKPLMRNEIKPVIDALLRYQQTGIANNVLILGSRGSGKSLAATYLMKLLSSQNQLKFVYVNCRHHNTSFKILAHLLGLRARGRTLDELWYLFTDANPGRTVFILDEIDLINDKDKHLDILYLISRSDKNYMAILLSNNPKFTNNLDESIRSTLQPEIIHFSSYNALEVVQILKDRAKVGLKFLPEIEIDQIAAMTVKNSNSDIRIAIKTLYLWAMEPEVSLQDHFEKARRDIMIEILKDLNDKNLLILKAALSQKEGYVKDIYYVYKKTSLQYNEDPFSYMHFYSNLSYLQSLGLILLISTKVDKTHTNRIRLTFDPSILDTIWKTRLE